MQPAAFLHPSPRLQLRSGAACSVGAAGREPARAGGLAPVLALAAGTGAPARQRACRRRSRRAAVLVSASFDLNAFNFNPLDYLKVPRHQTQVTLYPWMAAHERRELMRRWLQRELCMSEAQARSTLARCPALCELDVRLAYRRLRQLDRQLGISRMEAAMLALTRPRILLPAPADVVDWALEQGGRLPRGA